MAIYSGTLICTTFYYDDSEFLIFVHGGPKQCRSPPWGILSGLNMATHSPNTHTSERMNAGVFGPLPPLDPSDPFDPLGPLFSPFPLG